MGGAPASARRPPCAGVAGSAARPRSKFGVHAGPLRAITHAVVTWTYTAPGDATWNGVPVPSPVASHQLRHRRPGPAGVLRRRRAQPEGSLARPPDRD